MEQEFILKSFKIEDFEVESKYRVVETGDDGEVMDNYYHIHCGRLIHEDMGKLFDEDLRQILTDIFGSSENEIRATGVEFAGKDENIGMRIIGEIATAFGTVRFRTPRIKYLTGTSEACARMTVFADKIVEEAHAYLFEGKSADIAVFGE